MPTALSLQHRWHMKELSPSRLSGHNPRRTVPDSEPSLEQPERLNGAPGAAGLPDKLAFEVNEFCRLFSIGRTTFYEEVKARRLTVRKIGSKTIILADDVRQWMADLPSTAPSGQRQGGPK